MKPNPTFEPAMQNNPVFNKLTNENKKPLISAINTLRKLPQNRKRVFKGQLDVAFKNQNLNKMKEIRNKAVMENREISEKEKRNKEEAKKVEEEKLAKMKAKKAVKLEPIPPNAPKPNKPSFRALVQKNKEKRVMNAVKTAAQKTAISQATGMERKKLAVKYAPRTQANVTKVNGFGKIFKSNVRKEAEKAAVSAKKYISETDKMKVKAMENKKFNNSLAEKRRILREREAKSNSKKK